MKPYSFPCRQCGARFTTASAAARYCSRACQQRAYREREARRRELLRKIVAEVMTGRNDAAQEIARALAKRV